MPGLFADARAVFFDVDNTLYDFEESMAHAFVDLHGAFRELSAFRVDEIASAYWAHYSSFPEDEKVRLVHKDFEHYRLVMWSGALTKLGLHGEGPEGALARAVTERFAGNRPEHFRRALYPGSLETMRALSQSRAVGVITNGPTRVQRPKLSAFGCDAHVPERLVFVSEEFGVRKPDASIFLAAAKAAGVSPSECLMVGDAREFDMPAKAVGFRTVLFDGKKLSPDCRGDPYPPDAIVRSYAELDSLLS